MKITRLFLMLIPLLSLLLSGCNNNLGENDVQQSEKEEDIPEETEAPLPAILESKPLTSHLAGLPIEDFFEKAFNLILLRDPEWIVGLGLNELLDGEPSLTRFGPDDLTETNTLHEEILALLHEYDYDSLNSSNQISYQVFEFYLDGSIQRYQNSEYEYLVNPLSIRSWPQLFVMFFTDSHPLNSKVDAEAYVARVRLLDEKIDELI